jgi:hypothetical protein
MEVIGQLEALAALHEGKGLPVSLDSLQGGPHSRSGRGGEKNSQPPQGIEPPKHRSSSPELVATSTELRRLSLSLENSERESLLRVLLKMKIQHPVCNVIAWRDENFIHNFSGKT